MKTKSPQRVEHPITQADIERLIKEEMERDSFLDIMKVNIDAGCHPSAPKRSI
ncbi:MAG: hypothetical protein ACPL28_11035 [bacterium]